MFMDDQTNAQIAPSGLFRNSGPNLSSGYTINCNNPLMSLSQAAGPLPGRGHHPRRARRLATTTCSRIGYRFASVPRNSDITHTDYKVDVGLRGDLGSGWSYDVYAQLGVTRVDSHITGYASINKVQNALNVVYAPGTTTPPVRQRPAHLRSAQHLPAARARPSRPAAFNYVLADAFTTGESRQQIVGRHRHRRPRPLWPEEPLGRGRRRRELRRRLSPRQPGRELRHRAAGRRSLGRRRPVAADLAARSTSRNSSAKLRVPLAHDLPFIQDLTFDAGYRFSHYNLAGDTNTYKFGVEYQPVQDLLLRGSYNRAVRAPNVTELFAPQITGLAVYTDPCASDTGKPLAPLGPVLEHRPDCGAVRQPRPVPVRPVRRPLRRQPDRA